MSDTGILTMIGNDEGRCCGGFPKEDNIRDRHGIPAGFYLGAVPGVAFQSYNFRPRILLFQNGSKFKVDQAEAGQLRAVSDVAEVSVVVPDAIGFELGEEFGHPGIVHAFDAAAAVGGDHQKFIRLGGEQAGNKGASALLKILEHADFVSEALRGLGSTKGFMNAPVIAKTNGGAGSVLDLIHAVRGRAERVAN